MRPDPVTELEIDAYIDGELELCRRLAVEDHLAHSPEAAARVMADLRTRTALRLAQSPLGDAPAVMVAAAISMSNAAQRVPGPGRSFFSRGRTAIGASAVAAVCAVALITVAPRDAKATPPAYIGDAVMAFHTGVLRAAMPSQAESRIFDARDVERSTRIRVPTLPDGWQITDVQLFPSGEGPALQIMARTVMGQVVSVFAVHSSVSAPRWPIAVRHDGASVAYWRNGDMAYALTGVETPEALDIAAADLADNRLD